MYRFFSGKNIDEESISLYEKKTAMKRSVRTTAMNLISGGRESREDEYVCLLVASMFFEDLGILQLLSLVGRIQKCSSDIKDFLLYLPNEKPTPFHLLTFFND